MNKKVLHLASVGVLAMSLAPMSFADHDDDAAPRSQGAGHETNVLGASKNAPTVGSTGVISPTLTWHGGPVMNTPTIYYIYYGNWNQPTGSDTAAGRQILEDFGHTIGGSPYFKINTTYKPSSGATISGNVSFGGTATDAYSQGTSLSDNGVLAVVNKALSTTLPYDPNGIYFVLTSSDVNETSGFCTQYCGWHTAGTSTRGHVRYSFVGNANRCLGSCSAQTVSPNGNAGVDGMISVLAHELEETTTDPDLNSYYDRRGAENGDKCAWTFGTSTALPSGAFYNVTLGAAGAGSTRNYLIQRNLKFIGSSNYCTLN